jgi:hypothetical protein
MSGLDPIIASTLASRLDSVLSSVASGTSTATQTGTAQQAGVSNPSAANTPANPANPANALPDSAEATLSNTALAVDAILRSDTAPPGPVVSPVPLIATPPGQPSVLVQTAATLVDLAGTSNAAVTTTLLNELGQALLGNTATQNPAAALNAANGLGNNANTLSSTTALNSTTALSNTGAATNNPLATSALAGVSAGATEPLVVALASALQQSVESSGLFYESHLAQWLVGTRSLADLLDEPQARVTTTAQPTPAQPQNQSQTSPDTSGLASRLTATLASTLMGGNAAAGARGAMPSGALAQSLTADNAAANSSTLANNANNAASIVVNPQLLPLVRQQLDVLSEGQFRWAGEAWPGTPMDWQIERRAGEGGASDSAEGTTWRTRISIELPSLGRVDAELSLNAQQLSARIKAEPSGAATLVNGSADFRRRAAAAGLDLRAFQVLHTRSATTAAMVETVAASGERVEPDEAPSTVRLTGPHTP